MILEILWVIFWGTILAAMIACLRPDPRSEATPPPDEPPKLSPPPPALKPCSCVWCPVGCIKSQPPAEPTGRPLASHPFSDDFQAFLDELNRQSEQTRPLR